MKAALLLVDLQHDFLRTPGLEPAAGELIERAASLLAASRSIGLPVIHVRTSVDPDRDDRMPHWKRRDHRACVVGTPGHASPAALEPRPGEAVVDKTFYSGFQSGQLDELLAGLDIEQLGVAGVHLHGCVRATVLDAYQRGYEVRILEDVVASDDPLHAAETARYLSERAAGLVPASAWLSEVGPEPSKRVGSAEIVLPAAVSGEPVEGASLERIDHVSPRDTGRPLWSVPVCNTVLVSRAAETARRVWTDWRVTPVDGRGELLLQLAGLLERERELLARRMAEEVGKPLREGRAEVERSVLLLRSVAATAEDTGRRSGSSGGFYHRVPLGLVGVITPWNNPLAIPLGKIAPALLYGNAVLWKPAIPGSWIATHVLGLLREAGCPPGLVGLVCGDRGTAEAVMRERAVDAVSLSGSPAAGYAAQAICGGRRIPLQAELGGNNAAIVWSDADLDEAANLIVRGAFGFAGQRCTANRRVVVEARCRDRAVRALSEAAERLVWGDPLEPHTDIGPLISEEKKTQVAATVSRAEADGARIHRRDAATLTADETTAHGAYSPPTIVECEDERHEIVQEETFGPVLVLQPATDWDRAIELSNGVRQGLVAALFSRSDERREAFLRDARAGVLKLDLATDGAGVDLPFGGIKGSGVGPPEHGPGNREFYTRLQAIYTRAGTEV